MYHTAHSHGKVLGLLTVMVSPGSVPSSHLRMMLCFNTPISSSANIRNRSNRRSRSLFLGNIPETACRMICCNHERSLSTRMQCNTIRSCPTHLIRVFLQQVLVPTLLQATRIHGVMIIHLLIHFVPRHNDIFRVCDNDVVPTIHWLSHNKVSKTYVDTAALRERTTWIKYGLILPHQHYRNTICEFSEGSSRRVDMMPNLGIGKHSLKTGKPKVSFR